MGRRSEVSAGLVVYRRGADGPDYLLAHPGGPYWARKDDGAWTIPKGLVESGHALLATAEREFLEETGLRLAGPFVPLPPVKQKSGKIVHGFACEGDFDPVHLSSNTFEIAWPPKSGQRKSFPEIDRVEWFGLTAARERILAYQLPFLVALEDTLSQR